MSKTDTRIVYGARCTWWDSIDKVATLDIGPTGGLPCCPHCRGVLMEVPTAAEWWAGADKYEANGHPGYHAMIEWMRGRCFKNMDAATAAYEARERGRP